MPLTTPGGKWPSRLPFTASAIKFPRMISSLSPDRYKCAKKFMVAKVG
jgi:hypothetical protein